MMSRRTSVWRAEQQQRHAERIVNQRREDYARAFTLPPTSKPREYDGTWAAVCAGIWEPTTNECDRSCKHYECRDLRDWQKRLEAIVRPDPEREFIQWYRDRQRRLWLIVVYPDAEAADYFGVCTDRQAIRCERTGALLGYADKTPRPLPLWHHPTCKALVYMYREADYDCFTRTNGPDLSRWYPWNPQNPLRDPDTQYGVC